MTSTTRYEYWQHGHSGEVWAVRLSPLGRLTGTCGPLHYTEHGRPELLPDYHYDDDDDETAWIRQHDREFTPLYHL